MRFSTVYSFPINDWFLMSSRPTGGKRSQRELAGGSLTDDDFDSTQRAANSKQLARNFDEYSVRRRMAHWREIFDRHITFASCGHSRCINDPKLRGNDIVVPLEGAERT